MLKPGTIYKAVISLLLILIVSACATTEEHWKQALRTSSIEAYEAFLQRHPTSEYAQEAKARLETLYAGRDWRAALQTDDINSYETFLRGHPTSEYGHEAKARLEILYPRRDWKAALLADDIDSFETFLRRHPTSEYAHEAKARLEILYTDRDWKATLQTDDINSYDTFLRTHPKSTYVPEATSRVESLRRYFDGWQKLQKAPSLKAYRAYVARNPQSPYVSKAKEAVADMEGRDLLDLLSERKIEIETEGNGIESVELRARRRVPYPLTLKIPVGTFFVSQNSSSQNMVTTASLEQTLSNDEWVSLSLSAACANRSRDIPKSDDHFSVQRSPHQDELTKLMPVLSKADVPYGVRQAAIWIVTDDADYDDLGILVVSQFGNPFGGTREINEYESAMALKICNEAGIEITQKAIWRDRKRILEGLKDEALKKWLLQRQ